MKATFQREGLLAAFQLASAAVSSREIKPILRNLKIVVAEERCTLMATDLEVGIRLEVRGVKSETPGEAIVPTTRMIAILREATDEEVHLEASSERCELRGQTNEFEMPSEDPANFPDVPAFSEEKYHEVSTGTLRERIRRTIFASATENPRYKVTGTLWELEDSQSKLRATDGRRLPDAQGTATAHRRHTTRGQTPDAPTKAMWPLARKLAVSYRQVRDSFP